ncbi:protein jagged-1-like [Watersipora subatra]|uniref:protein jagged-1-like n=1 Tax=Watersipora subatra TaxID=2589382 RepID=UPI00355C66A3
MSDGMAIESGVAVAYLPTNLMPPVQYSRYYTDNWRDAFKFEDFTDCGGKACENGGTLTKDCECHCTNPWNIPDQCQDCGEKFCKNGGFLNRHTCQCICAHEWDIGDECDVKCSAVVESAGCREGGQYYGQCLTSSQAQYNCPLTCNICEQRDCGEKFCKNGGFLNRHTCQCICAHEGDIGDECDVDCTAVVEPADCDDKTSDGQCTSSEETRYNCPLACNICNIQDCMEKTCENGSTLNIFTCECIRAHPWNTPERCEVNCSAVVESDDCKEGGIYFGHCDNLIQAQYSCPLTCDICQPKGTKF